jgi:excisionase family DNA binding protein
MSDTTERDELAAVIDAAVPHAEVPGFRFTHAVRAADAAQEAGFRKAPAASTQLLTTRQAAEVLDVSRPTVVKLLEDGKIPFTRYGTARRIHPGDLLAYQERARVDRKAALAELSYESARDGTDDESNQFFTTRGDAAHAQAAREQPAQFDVAEFRKRFETAEPLTEQKWQDFDAALAECRGHRPAASEDVTEQAARTLGELEARLDGIDLETRPELAWEHWGNPRRAKYRVRAAALRSAGLLADGTDRRRIEKALAILRGEDIQTADDSFRIWSAIAALTDTEDPDSGLLASHPVTDEADALEMIDDLRAEFRSAADVYGPDWARGALEALHRVRTVLAGGQP